MRLVSNPRSRLPLTAFACVLLSVIVQPAAAFVPIPADPVTISGGNVSGTLLPSGVKAYLGMRYAAPPTQERRWRPPQPIRWDGNWVADRKGAECIQVLRPHDINHYFGEEPTGEDCLYLNLWAPPTAKPGARLPVIVFIYGGGGTIGSSGMAIYDGESVAKHGALFVSFNYRVGLLGFMAHPELSAEQGGHSGNYGYLDQNAALRWVRDNVAAFGGDPDKVLVAGQSFGAGSVVAHLFSPLSRGLFRAAAMWSACDFTAVLPGLQEAQRVGLEVQQRLGAADVQAMRNVPADRLLALQAENQVGLQVRGVRASPLVDGYFTVAQRSEALASGGLADVPILVSSNGDDLDVAQYPLARARTLAEYRALVQQLYGNDAAEFLRRYPARTDADVAATVHLAARERGMLRQSRECARLHSTHATSHAYVALFARRHSYAPGVRLADQDPATVGAYHTADVPFWLGTLDAFNLLRPTRQWTDADRRFSDDMLAALIAFAATGSPGGARDWPAWSASKENYVVLGERAEVQALPGARMDWIAAKPLAPVPPASAPSGPRD